ncbi:MAG: T9SS type A sorting domain-containing protein [candidate division KSB1 bacterium]|nr:T9SS type A sorting domain-containing protein [candidate division KSB1 bacterium]MDZ7304539.1 T9SS type A sorting domain-containing protein [candidate division KSB1 bacterium]MDZ7313708.1 T9SS type A sorting domain-containing protein [candidate division KSB1 bacterium]
MVTLLNKTYLTIFATLVFLNVPGSLAAAPLSAGGPDTFGYRWKDSDEPGGPTFNYLDISSSGTLVTGLTDDNVVGPLPIGFGFLFYGTAYTEFYIASNGFIGFGPTSGYGAYTNRELPTTYAPNNIIAWLWDDLAPRDDTEIYYQSFSDKLVVQFVNLGNANSGYSNQRVNAEVILYNSGKILVQYLNFTSGWPLNLATVGIENTDGTDGLTVVYNAPYLHNSLAVQFYSPSMPPEAPILISPANNATGQPTILTLKWNASEGATSYRAQVAEDLNFTNIVFDSSTITTTWQIGPLANIKTYYWRVNARNDNGASAWSSTWKFTTKDDAQIGAPITVNTKSGFKKANQSKVFYYDSQWWAIAFYETTGKWYIWRYSGNPAAGAYWARTCEIEAGINYHCDAVINSSTGKLYVFCSHKTTPHFWRFSYAGGTWNKDSGYPVTLSDFTNVDQGNPVSLVQAKNGNLWIFRIHNNNLQAKRSTNEGKIWSATINVKTGLNTIYGTTDAVAFTGSAGNYVGVAYGERDTVGSKFGFLHHRDGDPIATWTDESASLTFYAGERAVNNICMTVDADNNIYLITRNLGASGNLPRNTLYKRTNAGSWQKFKVNSSSTYNWKTPVIVIDGANTRIYCMGVNTTTSIAEYKTCLIGQEATLDTAKVEILFYGTGASFDDLSVPAANVTAVSGLMVCGDNKTANDIWFRLLSTGNTAPLTMRAIKVNSNEINANATYKIPLTLSSAGALTAGAGTLHFRFPSTTLVPDTMPANAVLVDGAPATSIISNSSTKQVTIVTPVNLPNNHSFSVVFNPAAGLLNPATVGTNYKITAWTSAQPTQINSPAYSLVQATTTVTPATVTLSTTEPGSPADYTLNFNLGDHGRMLAGTGTFTVMFDSATSITHGALTGVTVNTVNAAAMGESAARKIIITLPTTVTLGNNAEVMLFLPSPAVRNPTRGGKYWLTVATSTETEAVASNPYVIPFFAGRPIADTEKNFDRSNQSKMFYHGGVWWVTAQAKDDLYWYLWKFDGATWERTIQLYNSGKVRPDCILDAANNKAFILLPGASTTYILRLTYTFGNWTIDSGYPYAIPDFPQASDRGMNLVRAANGSLWVFRISGATLYAKRSSTNGQTWSSAITIKSNLHHDNGLTDAVVFVYNGSNHIGVGYAENSVEGSIYGFLRHKDTDANNVWTDETAAIPQFSGTTSDDHISMTVHNNTIFMIVKTNGGGPSTANVGLLRRDPNGSWFQHPIMLSSGWTRPTLVVDQTHNRLYVFGTREGPVNVGEMKHVAIGAYDDLVAAPIDTIFSNDTDSFFDTSVPAHPVNSTMNLLVCNGNETRHELWYNLINLAGSSKAAPNDGFVGRHEYFEGVHVFPNPFNAETCFRFKVPENASVKLQIFNLNGQLVRTLVEGHLPKGVHQQRWNGRSNDGHQVASGIYLYRMQIGGKTYCGRVQMIK